MIRRMMVVGFLFLAGCSSGSTNSPLLGLKPAKDLSQQPPQTYSLKRTCSDGVAVRDYVVDELSSLVVVGDIATLTIAARSADGVTCRSIFKMKMSDSDLAPMSGMQSCSDGRTEAIDLTGDKPERFMRAGTSLVMTESGFQGGGSCNEGQTLTMVWTPVAPATGSSAPTPTKATAPASGPAPSQSATIPTKHVSL